MAALDVWQVTAVYGMYGVNMANVFYLKVIDDTGIADEGIGVRDVFINQVIPDIKVFQSDDLTYECFLLRKVFPQSTPAEVHLTSLTGDVVGSGHQTNQVLTISHYSEDGRPRYRGRYFISGFPKTWSALGRVGVPHKGKADALATLLTGTITENTHTYRMQHFSNFLSTFHDIMNVRMQPILTKHRNRTPGTCSIT